MFKLFQILYPNKDNVINSYYYNSNLGRSFVLPITKNIISLSSLEYSRVLLNFNVDELIDFYGIHSLTSNSFTASLFLYELKNDVVYHNDNFNINLYTLTANYSEGESYQYDFSETGYSNWINNFNGSNWSSSGGEYSTSISATTNISNGSGDLNFDVRAYIQAYLYLKTGLSASVSGFSSTSQLRGFLLKYADLTESSTSFSDNINYYSRHTHTIYSPRIYFKLNKEQEFDNRNNFIFGKQQTLYFPNLIDGELESYSLSSFEINKDNNSITGISYTASTVEPGLIKVDISSISENNYSVTSIYNDIWLLSNGISITGRFNAYSNSDYIGLDYKSLTGNFNKNYISHSTINKIGIISRYSKSMEYNSTQLLTFNPYLKKGAGVDNVMALFNNDLFYPQEFYIKFIDEYSNFEFTDWIKLDLLGDSYKLIIDTKSFNIGSTINIKYKMKYFNEWLTINANSSDAFEIKGNS